MTANDREVHWWRADLTEHSAVRDLLATVRADTIFHLAGHVAGGPSLDLVVPTFRSNLIGTVNLLALAAETDCRRVVLAGSSYEPECEKADNPVSPYAISKWAASGYARMFHRLHSLPVVTLRIYMAYGPAQRDREKLIPYVITSLLREKPPKLASGERQVDWVYVDDVVDALLTAAVVDHAEGETLEIGSGELVSVRRTVELIREIIGSRAGPIFGAQEDGPREELRLMSDPEASRRMTGWMPKVPLAEGLRRTVAWWRNALLLALFPFQEIVDSLLIQI
jgi:nucleoside-diphosphate-sugar epimerase